PALRAYLNTKSVVEISEIRQKKNAWVSRSIKVDLANRLQRENKMSYKVSGDDINKSGNDANKYDDIDTSSELSLSFGDT
ncbi:hypothetical protein Tco_0438277, partial [Tanacetum coccineum]